MARIFSDPFDSLYTLQRALDSFRRSDWLGPGLSGLGGYPPLNVFRQGQDFVVLTELPGVDRDDLDIQVKDNNVRIAGRKKLDYGDIASVHRRERVARQFDRSVALPVEIDADGVKAEYRDGILALFLPRAEQDKPRSVKVN